MEKHPFADVINRYQRQSQHILALVNEITENTKERQKLHAETTCLSSVFTDDDGRRYIQLDTYGSTTRQMTIKVSQSIQLSRQASAQLKKLIESTYPELK